METELNLNRQRDFFNTGATLSHAFRIEQLKKLKKIVTEYELQIYEALQKDLSKSKTETWISELSFVHSELDLALRKLKGWMKPKKVASNLVNFPSRNYIYSEPLGVVLIIGPWNYPFHLMMVPLISAIAAGNCVCLKCSEYAPATSSLIHSLIRKHFDSEFICCAEGDGETVVGQLMNRFVFDHVFFTGSPAVGKIIYQMAAAQLVPVTLELGGKCPAIVEADADIPVAAKRIAFAKFLNAGQTCVAPDYVLVQQSRKAELLDALSQAIVSFYTTTPQQSEDFGRIINQKHFDRLQDYLKEGEIVFGGELNREQLFISPTLLDNISLDSPIMQHEIFGPLLPVIGYDHRDEAKTIIRQNKNPLALYLFTKHSAQAKEWMRSTAFGGGCVNNAAVQLTNPRLPFGGRGMSGTGNYHGKFGFDNFSHQKPVLMTSTWFDPVLKYPPFSHRLKLFKKLLG